MKLEAKEGSWGIAGLLTLCCPKLNRSAESDKNCLDEWPVKANQH